MQHLETVKKLFENDSVCPENPDIFGFHGTSIEAIKYLAIHGRMPRTGACGRDFHFCPKDGQRYLRGPYEEAKTFARINTIRNLLMKELIEAGIILTKRLRSQLLTFAEGECSVENNNTVIQAIMRQLKFGTQQQLETYLSQLRTQRQGVIIGIRKTVRQLSLQKGADEDLVIRASQGLSIKHIAGIEPLSQFEYDEIASNDLKNVQMVY